jgi:hypothetical protein
MHKFHNKHLDWSVRFADGQQFTKPDTDPDDSSSVPVSVDPNWVPKEVKHPISQMWDVHSVITDDHEPASCSCLPPFLFSWVSIGGQNNSMIEFFFL